ncbi:MAG: CpsB/CapC family capsule biosynthesis tyrosine phosphatase [Cytophagales bacterium]
MSWFSSVFSTSAPVFEDSIKVEFHNHILPGLDDGSRDVFESLELLKNMQELRKEKVVMTPHIISDMYKNSPETILPKLELLKIEAQKANINLELHAAAEYYVDETFLDLSKSDNPILSFGTKKKYVLIETAFMNKSPFLKEVIFNLQSRGYVPILAHPERYVYLYDDFEKYEDIFDSNIKFQINILSLAGYYSPEAKKIAEKLIDAKMVHFLGSDCHNMKQMMVLKEAVKLKYYNKALKLNLLNNSIFD